MKRIWICFLLLLVCRASTAFALCGDVNGDGQILSNDVLMIARASIGTFSLDAEQKLRADVVMNLDTAPDGMLLSNDLLMVARASLGMFSLTCAAPTTGNDIAVINQWIAEEGLGWQAEENKITRLPDNEQLMMLGALIEENQASRYAGKTVSRQAASLPASFDWRNNSGNWMTPVKDQGKCGSCTVFSIIGALEAKINITENSTFADQDLSEQQVFSCGQGSCKDGMYISNGLAFLTNTGAAQESCLPYQWRDDLCGNLCANWFENAYKVKSWGYVQPGDRNAIKSVLTSYGPLPATMKVYKDFSSYKSGYVYKKSKNILNFLRGGHAVVIVGYDDAGQYWIVKNSWGPDWGENGYFRIAYGECEIEQNVYYIDSLCAKYASVNCYQDNLYWYDSCGNRGEQYHVCSFTTPYCLPAIGGNGSCVECTSNSHCGTGKVCGGSFTCIPDGAVSQCGNNIVESGEQCDDGNTIANDGCSNLCDFNVTTPFTPIQVSVGEDYTCALSNIGTVKCWGENGEGQLGDGSFNSRITPQFVFGLTNITQITTGSQMACALTNNGSVQCWGDNFVGQLGNGEKFTTSRVPVSVNSLYNATQISTSGGHTCARINDGTVKCWGFNIYGQIGDGTTTDKLLPVTVIGLNNVLQVSVSQNHSCALLNNGIVKCWGANNSGQLGDGTTLNRAQPVQVVLISNAVKISTGIGHSCALLGNTEIKCWGDNSEGQLGSGSYADSNTPVSVNSLIGMTDIGAGLNYSCAISNGPVSCWGTNGLGQRGDGSGIISSATARQVYDLFNASQITTGLWHACALLQDGRIKCWGKNGSGQLGDGTSVNRYIPVIVQGL